ncbi:MAG: hypothetical protein EB010_08695 [Acidimicrobiia bacterium]|nr:hypothetical protein [Acidimicrobiia bacterium]
MPDTTALPFERITNRPDESTFDGVPAADVRVTVATPSPKVIEPGFVDGGVVVGEPVTGTSFGSFGSSKQFVHVGGVAPGPAGGVNDGVECDVVAAAPEPTMLLAVTVTVYVESRLRSDTRHVAVPVVESTVTV